MVYRFTMCGKNIVYSYVFRNVHQVTLLTQTRFTMCGTETLFNNSLRYAEGCCYIQKEMMDMIERGLYYAKPEFGQRIRSLGGTWSGNSSGFFLWKTHETIISDSISLP